MERLKQQLALATESLKQQNEGDITQQSSASDQAMDILKRSSLEVELATKEKEVWSDSFSEVSGYDRHDKDDFE